MNGSLKELVELILKGAPNFVGFILALVGAWYVIQTLLARNALLTDALLSCAGAK
jgi:hypothetical protein